MIFKNKVYALFFGEVFNRGNENFVLNSNKILDKKINKYKIRELKGGKMIGKNKMLLVYPGLGKTFAAEQTDIVLEIQLSQFKNVNVKKLGDHFPEHLKGNFEPTMEINSKRSNYEKIWQAI